MIVGFLQPHLDCSQFVTGRWFGRPPCSNPSGTQRWEPRTCVSDNCGVWGVFTQMGWGLERQACRIPVLRLRILSVEFPILRFSWRPL